MNRNSMAGFSLMALMVSLAIVGIISAVLTSLSKNAMDSARQMETLNDVNTLQMIVGSTLGSQFNCGCNVNPTLRPGGAAAAKYGFLTSSVTSTTKPQFVLPNVAQYGPSCASGPVILSASQNYGKFLKVTSIVLRVLSQIPGTTNYLGEFEVNLSKTSGFVGSSTLKRTFPVNLSTSTVGTLSYVEGCSVYSPSPDVVTVGPSSASYGASSVEKYCPPGYVMMGCLGSREPNAYDNCDEAHCGLVGTVRLFNPTTQQEGCRVGIDSNGSNAPTIYVTCMKK